MKTNRFICLTVAVAALLSGAEANARRSQSSINDRWEFRLPADKNWQQVNIPHTYNLDAYNGMHYYQGKGLYRRNLAIDRTEISKRHYLKFDAASKAADVSVNGQAVGKHQGGYTAFIVDITDYIKPGDNLIEVTVDNSRQDVTPLWADFTFWGGIYRDAWHITTDDIHFNMANHGSDGIFITTPEVSEAKGSVSVRSQLTNDSEKDAQIILESKLFASDGKLVKSSSKKQKIKAGETLELTSDGLSVENPELWTPEEPRLYTVVTSIIDPKTKREIDSRSHRTAFRWWSFDGEKGFALNGKPYKLRGTNRHQDQWPVGVAVDDDVHRRDIKLLKDIGSNFIRISHYPQDDAILDACDELGLLVWEEIPIIDVVPDTPGYDDNCEENLVDMIRQHYNHPSVIMWGYMNEILLIAPRPGTPEWPACQERTVKLARRLEAKLKEEDPARTSVMAFNMTNLYNEIGLDLEDVAGWNLYHGWYEGELQGFNHWCEDQHQRYPNHPIIISEWGAGSDRRLQSFEPKAFDFSTDYQQVYVEHYLPYIEQTPWISGCAYWNFIDFNVAARQESMPRVNNKGLFYNDRSPKDIAYYFKAMWRDDVPVVRIACHDNPLLMKHEGHAFPLKVYSNAPEVELWLNGESQGVKKVENCHAIFELNLPEGDAYLSAKGIKDGKEGYDAIMAEALTEPTAKSNDLAINVGSNCYFTSALSNMTWLPDRPYEPGKFGYVVGTEKSTTSEIHGTVDGPIYQTWREGPVTYKIDCEPGEYEVELLMADVSRPAAQLANLLSKSNAEKASDAARYDIVVNGERVAVDYCPADGQRYRMASRLKYRVNAPEGGLTIELRLISGSPTLAGIHMHKL